MLPLEFVSVFSVRTVFQVSNSDSRYLPISLSSGYIPPYLYLIHAHIRIHKIYVTSKCSSHFSLCEYSNTVEKMNNTYKRTVLRVITPSVLQVVVIYNLQERSCFVSRVRLINRKYTHRQVNLCEHTHTHGCLLKRKVSR